LENRTLFLKNLPDDVTEEELKALSTDIIGLRIKENLKRGKKTKKFTFAFLEFSTEEACTKHYKELQHRKIRNKEIVVDYIGEKSGYVKKDEKKKLAKEGMTREPDQLRLHVGGFDKSTTEADVKKLFGTGFADFTMPVKKDSKQNMGFAFVTYTSEAEAKKALEKTNGKEIGGKKLSVDYAFKRVDKEQLVKARKDAAAEAKKKAVEKQAAKEPAAKKQKAESGEAAKAVAKKEVAKAVVPAAAAPKKEAAKAAAPAAQQKRKLEEEDDDDEDDDDEDDDEDDDDEDDDDEDDDEDDDDEDGDDDDEDDDDEDDDDEDDEE
jgi:RNA recognition motif-containing protein